MKEDVDAILQIVELKNGAIRGVWFSLQFGRVGTFELRKDFQTVPEIRLLEPLQGIYDSSQGYELYLDIRRDATPISSLNPYFPLTMGGYFIIAPGLSSRKTITGGSYDFYVGKIGVITEQKDQLLVGRREDTKLMLAKPSAGILHQQQPFAPQIYNLRP